MESRRNFSPAFKGRSVQAPGLMRHGPFPGAGPSAGHHSMEPLPPILLKDKVSVQEAEIEQLAGENHRLSAIHAALRQDLVATQQEVDGIRAHIRSMQTESDIQIRVLRDKIAKMDADIRSGESVKKDLQQAHMDAQSLVSARQELTTKVQRATLELQKANDDVRRLSEQHAELDILRQEHQRLRATFEYEKGLNIELVEQMQAMEKNLVAKAREVEKLRADVLTAENRSRSNFLGLHIRSYQLESSYILLLSSNTCVIQYLIAALNPYGDGHMNPDPLQPPPLQSTGPYVDGYGRPLVQLGAEESGQGTVPHGSINGVPATVTVVGAALPNSGGAAVWGGA